MVNTTDDVGVSPHRGTSLMFDTPVLKKPAKTSGGFRIGFYNNAANEDRHERSRSPPSYSNTSPMKYVGAKGNANYAPYTDNTNTGLLISDLKSRVAQLESTLEAKDSQIKAMLETIHEKEKEIEELMRQTATESDTANQEAVTVIEH